MIHVSMDEINKLVSLQLGVREVKNDSLLVEDLQAESADLVNLVLVLEEKYQIVVKESEIAKIKTPADLYNLVEMKLGDSH